MSNGMINADVVRTFLTSAVDKINGEYSVEDIESWMDHLKTHLVIKANTNIREVAENIVRDSFRATNGMGAKIAEIKAVRAATGEGLREAKNAVEDAWVIVRREQAEQALEALRMANATVEANNRYGAVKHIDATKFTRELTNLYAARRHPR